MGLKDYVRKKKEAFHAYQDKREVEKLEKRRTRDLKEKLDRETMMEERKLLVEQGKTAKVELKSLKESSRARTDIAEMKKYQREEKFKSSPLGQFASSFDQGVKSVSSSRGGDMFGSSMFGGDMFGNKKKPIKKTKKKRKGKKKKQKKKQGKSITINY